jgi:hypothetical protein
MGATTARKKTELLRSPLQLRFWVTRDGRVGEWGRVGGLGVARYHCKTLRVAPESCFSEEPNANTFFRRLQRLSVNSDCLLREVRCLALSCLAHNWLKISIQMFLANVVILHTLQILPFLIQRQYFNAVWVDFRGNMYVMRVNSLEASLFLLLVRRLSYFVCHHHSRTHVTWFP